MSEERKVGMCIHIPESLHAKMKLQAKEKDMSLEKFTLEAIGHEVEPKKEMEENSMVKSRTIAFQVDEDLRDRWDAYLARNGKKLKPTMIALMEAELEREQTEKQANSRENERVEEVGEEEGEDQNNGNSDGDSGDEEESEEETEEEENGEEHAEEQRQGPVMGGM